MEELKRTDKDHAGKRAARILRERRQELNMTQEAVALDVGISVAHYQFFEYGQRNIMKVNMKLGLIICATLELDPFELIFENDAAWVRKQHWTE